MTKFNFFLKSVGLFLFLFVSNLFAQTTITLSAACGDCKSSSNGTAVVSSYGNSTCTAGTSGTLNGTYTAGQQVTPANTMTLYANVMTAGSWSISTTANNGVTFSGSGTFATTGCQQITLTASGTPTLPGPLIAVTNTSPQGSAATTVQPASASNPSSNGTAIVTNYGNSTCANPSTGTINGTMTAGVAVSGVTMSLYANVTTAGSWSLSATQNGVTFTGSGTFNATGCQLINLNASGAPTNAGSFTWSTNSNPVGSAPSTVVAAFNPATITAGTGTFSGRTCFDVAQSNNNANSCGSLTDRIATYSADFTQSAINTQSYTFIPSGTVSNVRFYHVNQSSSGAIVSISGGNTNNNISNPVTAIVNYNSSNNTLATARTNSNALTSKIYVVYNVNATATTNPADDRILQLTATVKDCNCCGAVTYITPNSDTMTFREFLCHNLGADTSLDPHVPTLGLFGAHIQWGKRGPNITGDSQVDWQTAPTDGPNGFAAAPKAATVQTTDDYAIAGWSTIIPAYNAWSDFLIDETAIRKPVKAAADPCPGGYRVPTLREWSGLITGTANSYNKSGSWDISQTTFTSAWHYTKYGTNIKTLTLPASGYRGENDGTANWGHRLDYALNEKGWIVVGGVNDVPSYTGPDYELRGVTVRCIAE